MQILTIESSAFKKYGRVIRNVDFNSLIERMKETPVPDDVIYEPSDPN